MTGLSSPDVHLRAEKTDDRESIHDVNMSAFGTSVEADLVDALRAADAVTLSAVALVGASLRGPVTAEGEKRGGMLTEKVEGGAVVGHILFTPATVVTDKGDIPLLRLGPVAVAPAKQHQGIGTLMVSECLEHLRAMGHAGVVVTGEASYFRRFGFTQADRWGLASTIEVPEENFLVLELRPGHLGGITGQVDFRPEFDQD